MIGSSSSLLLGIVWEATGSALAAFGLGSALAVASAAILWTIVPAQRPDAGPPALEV